MNAMRWNQLWAVVRMEIRKSFFSKRSAWIYLLALAPLAIFGGHAFERSQQRGRRMEQAARNPGVTLEKMRRIQPEMKREEITAILGEPASQRTYGRGGRKREFLVYSDGNSELNIWLHDGEVERLRVRAGCNFSEDITIFAGVFQFFFLRLMVFFGCVFVFINLFRGELLDRSLHYYFLAPVRREVVVAGKFLAGLIATAIIFTVSVAAQLLVLNLHFDAPVLEEYVLRGHAWQHAFAYIGVTALAVLGYGSVFLTSGILLRNPLFPAAVMLLWESINGLLPSFLRKISIIYYLKSLAPVEFPIDRGVPPPLAMLVMNVEPVAPLVAVVGVIAVSAGLLFWGARKARTLEINYGAE